VIHRITTTETWDLTLPGEEAVTWDDLRAMVLEVEAIVKGTGFRAQPFIHTREGRGGQLDLVVSIETSEILQD
jgi:hypothetical protein